MTPGIAGSVVLLIPETYSLTREDPTCRIHFCLTERGLRVRPVRRRRARAQWDASRAHLQRLRDLRRGAEVGLLALLGLPGARVRDPPGRRLRGPPRHGELVHREPRGRRLRARHVQHVPAPRHAGVPGRAGQRLALPLPVPRVVLPQRRPPGGPALPQGGVRRRGRLQPARAAAPPRAGDGHRQRADLRLPGSGGAAAARVPRRLRVLPRLLHPAEPERGRGARTPAVADQGQLEDRRGELRRGHVPHPADPRERRGDRALPRAEGREAQGRHDLLGRRRRGRWRSACATSATPTR